MSKPTWCVVGGGCTGLSAALHAAERGLKVVLLEGGKIGWGASGRNGGQMIPGLRKGAKGLVKLYGPERAKVLFDLAFEARGLVLDIIERHAIDCDLRLTGHLVGAVNGSDLKDLEEEARVPRERDEVPRRRDPVGGGSARPRSTRPITARCTSRSAATCIR